VYLYSALPNALNVLIGREYSTMETEDTEALGNVFMKKKPLLFSYITSKK